MKRLRQIKKYGNSFVIALFQTDMKDMELKEGDEVDIQLIKKEGSRKWDLLISSKDCLEDDTLTYQFPNN